MPIVVGREAAHTPSFFSVFSSIFDATTRGGAHCVLRNCIIWLRLKINCIIRVTESSRSYLVQRNIIELSRNLLIIRALHDIRIGTFPWFYVKVQAKTLYWFNRRWNIPQNMPFSQERQIEYDQKPHSHSLQIQSRAGSIHYTPEQREDKNKSKKSWFQLMSWKSFWWRHNGHVGFPAEPCPHGI